MRTCLRSLILIVLFTGLGLSAARAQENAFSQDKIIVSAGYGFGNLTKALLNVAKDSLGFKAATLGPLYAKFEYGISETVGIGLNVAYFGASASWNFQDADVNGNPATYKAKIDLKSYSVLARINFHFASDQHLDPYFGLGLGFRGGRWKTSTDDPKEIYNFDAFNKSVFPLGFETTLGLRYYPLNDQAFSLYCEVGAAKSIIQFGLSYRFDVSEFK